MLLVVGAHTQLDHCESHVSQGSVATCLRCDDESVNDDFIANV